MIDIKILREDPERVKTACKHKNVSLDIDAIVSLDARRRNLSAKVDELNRERNEAAKAKDIEKGKALKVSAVDVEAELAKVEEELSPLLLKIPNLPSDDTPIGPDESGNVVVRQVGEIPSFAFEPKDHVALGEALGWIDSEQGAAVVGARFAYMKGGLVLLQMAVSQYVVNTLTDRAALEHIIAVHHLSVPATPFVPVIPPLLIRPEVMQKMARLEPRDERYHIASDDLYLIGSAEHTLGPLHMDQTLKAEQLPIRYVAQTSAFRREAGSYGKDMRGIIRLHQFEKMEMESFSTPEQGIAEQDFFVAIQEHITTALGLPYQVVMTCTGDQGDPDARHIDIETWMPGHPSTPAELGSAGSGLKGKYRETHSADYMTDYQSRRLNTKIKGEKGSVFVHMNDATAFAGRTLVAIMENYQRQDGSIGVPEVLRPYLGGKEILT